VDLQVTNSLLSDDVGSDNQVLKAFLLALNQLKLFNMAFSVCSILSLRVLCSDLLILNFLKKILNILRGGNKVILPVKLGRLVLQSELLHKQGIRVLRLRELKSGTPWGMEVDT